MHRTDVVSAHYEGSVRNKGSTHYKVSAHYEDSVRNKDSAHYKVSAHYKGS